MDKDNEFKLKLCKESLKREDNKLSSFIKSECDNVFKQHIVEENMAITTKFIKEEPLEMDEDGEKNKTVNLEHNTLQDGVQIKVENIEVEPEFETYFSDHSLNVKENPYEMVEFVGIRDVKMEVTNEFVKEENVCDPIDIHEGAFICHHCEKAFTTSEYCQKHKKRCQLQSTSTDDGSPVALLNNDYMHVDSIEKLYQCDSCGDNFTSSSALHSHSCKQAVQTEGKSHICPQCDKKFSTSWNLKTHILRHTGVTPYKCTECHKAFITSNQLTRHMRVHTGEKPYECIQCEKAFTTSYHLTHHMRSHTGERPFICTQCAKTFSQSSDLIKHVRTHTGEKPHKCTECDKAFCTSSNLIHHMRLHTGERPYKCAVCDKAFSQSGHLKKHMKVHSGEKSFKCSVCDETFTCANNWFAHMKVHKKGLNV